MNGGAGCGESMNGGEGWGESANGAANQIYGGQRVEWQDDGVREVVPANSAAGWGEPANGAVN